MSGIIQDTVCLGIESTAHTFGVAVTRGDTVLSNEKAAYTTEQGGMIPSEVADHHRRRFYEVTEAAMREANISWGEVDCIAYSRSPGLGNCLRIGAVAARSLAIRLKKPLVAVNHCVAHLEVGRIRTRCEDPVMLYASGANTQVIAYKGGRYRVFGETLDMGIGNFLDSLGRELGFGFPGGPRIEEEARKASGELRELPYSVKGMDVNFGGLFTHLKRIIESEGDSLDIPSLCFSVQETVFAMLVEITERAMAHTKKEECVLAGGVGCNKRLQEMLRIMCEERGASFYCPETQFLVDNAAMIAYNGAILFEAGETVSVEEADIDPYQRTDQVLVSYRR